MISIKPSLRPGIWCLGADDEVIKCPARIPAIRQMLQLNIGFVSIIDFNGARVTSIDHSLGKTL
jgi:hypothetical protein